MEKFSRILFPDDNYPHLHALYVLSLHVSQLSWAWGWNVTEAKHSISEAAHESESWAVRFLRPGRRYRGAA
jgi:hypothetical protein